MKMPGNDNGKGYLCSNFQINWNNLVKVIDEIVALTSKFFFTLPTFKSVSFVCRWSVIRGLKRKSNSLQRDKEISEDLPVQFVASDTFSWLPAASNNNVADENKSGKVLLFYKYR